MTESPDNNRDNNRDNDRDNDRAEMDRRFEQLVASLRTPEPSGQQPFSLDQALSDAEPDDEPFQPPVAGHVPMRPGLVLGFGLMALAFVLAFVGLMGVQLSHELGVVGASMGVIGLVVLLLNVRRGPRDDGDDYDPRDGSRI